jgi:hypothetical protein
MTAEDFNREMVERLIRLPFRPFVVELLDGERVEIVRQNSFACRGGKAGGFGRDGAIVDLECDKVSRVVDGPLTTNSTKN